MSEFLDLDEVQRRILQLRLSSSGIGGVQGPPGTGKSLGMACEALRSVDNGQAPVVIAAFGNKTVDHVVRYARSLHIQAGGTDESFRQ